MFDVSGARLPCSTFEVRRIFNREWHGRANPRSIQFPNGRFPMTRVRLSPAACPVNSNITLSPLSQARFCVHGVEHNWITGQLGFAQILFFIAVNMRG